jgi:ribosomal protein L6P/L9E
MNLGYLYKVKMNYNHFSLTVFNDETILLGGAG